MTRGLQQTAREEHVLSASRRNHLLQHHPVLTPILFLSCAVILGILTFVVDSFLPWFTFLGLPPAQFFFSLTLVLGTTGILISIIGIIECLERPACRPAMFAKPKE